jgi:hypothetical protein
MAVHRSSSGSDGAVPWLAYLVGALIVVVAALLWRVWSESVAPPAGPLVIKLHVPTPPLPKLPLPPSMPTR